MQTFTVTLKLLAALTALAGLLHVLLGPGADVLLGARLPAEVLRDPVLDSQNRFYGAVFIGYGALLYRCASDVRRHATLLRIVAGFVFLGAVARLVSICVNGLPGAPLLVLVAVELIGVPLLLLWHRKVLGSH